MGGNRTRTVSRALFAGLVAGTILLAGGTGCQSLDSSHRARVRLDRATAAIESEVGNTNRAAAALRNYRLAVDAILPREIVDPNGGPNRLLRPAPGVRRVRPWTRPDPRYAGLHRNGIGLPVVETIRPGGPNAPRDGYRVAVTALARENPWSPDSLNVELVDPSRINTVEVGSREMKVAMDLEAPLNATKGMGPRLLDGLAFLLRPNLFSGSRLTFLQPYDPEKTPVILIHGLLSTPRMWAPVVKSLLANERIRERYQFWFFYYPTGQPIPLSALQLRRSLDEARMTHHVRQPIILIGHSMGGILARTQITGIKPEEADQILPGVAALPHDNPVREALIFQPRTDIQRAVFIATPHRGSHFALNSLAGLGVQLIRLPVWVQSELASITELPFGDRMRRFPTSICGLSPNSRFLQELDGSHTSVPMHSIIANRGQSDLENSSDGVVAYSSAHIPNAASEKIVPGGHGAFSHPAAIAEIERILLEQ